jgi:glycosyltransferase involved in cell wall biosynthesis
MPAVRILVCASEAPRAPLNGSRLVLHEVVKRLAVRDEVVVHALRWPDQDGPAPDGIELHEVPMAPLNSWAVRLRALALREPVDVRRLAAPFRGIDARGFDVAHVMLGSLAGLRLDVPAVIAPLDAWHLNVRAEAERASGLERLWRRAQERAVRRWESSAYRPFGAVVLVTEEDAREVARLDPSLHVVTIPNGVDAAHFAPPPAERSGVLFTGALDAPANEAAAIRLTERIMPLVRREIPDAELRIVGRNPRIPGAIANVPDLRPYLWSAAAYACPMESGTGIKNKLLEAMAAGAPAVATTLAMQGIRTEHVLVADTDEAFAAALVCTLRDPGDRADAARADVRAHHDWDAVAAAYRATYERVR